MNIPAGSEVLIGAPSVEMKQVRREAIVKAVSKSSGITEAHLPQCYVYGAMPAPAQVLLVVIDPAFDAEFVLKQLFKELETAIPLNDSIDVWPTTQAMPLMATVRGAGCMIFPK